MNTLVIGATGKVGSETVKALLGRGATVKALVRSEEKARALPPGVLGAIGDLESPASLPGAFQGAGAVFLITPLSPDEAQMGVRAVEAAREAGVRRLVYLSVMMPPDSLGIPHFQSKVPVAEALQRSGMEYTVLYPNNFFQNDLLAKDAIVKYGLYPDPIGDIGLNRVDVRDIADAAAAALTDSGHSGQGYPLCGPDAVTGEGVAAVYSRHLGRPVRYAGNDLDAWAGRLRNFVPDWMIHDLRIMFQYFQEHGLRASEADFTQQRRILGRDPRSFDAFAGEAVAAWKQAA